jgi:hypothetical protein
MTVVQTKDKRKIYIEDTTLVYDDVISQDYSNEFVNEDNTLWDWDKVPYIDFVNIRIDD